MWKTVFLIFFTMLTLQGLVKGAPLRPEEKWKPLDNPRNRDLFFRTLSAYFSGRDLRKFPGTFSLNNDGSKPVTFYLDPIASALADYEERKNSFPKYFRG
ncbi:PREDICTED: uncharacterized protein C2orf66 homolog [Gavialis gangeticus]|uniref:uncharacterized protein C2orf66 homolog n=1 Tax=Gavialis gangeticus TaxID=94835 RepID=UPI00092EA547|nr:PREDICTED: uncharacterized protein C2orf66 homolog [Gavialis gangeticus]